MLNFIDETYITQLTVLLTMENDFNFIHPDIDGAYLLEMYEGDKDILTAVFEEFLNNHDQMVTELEEIFAVAPVEKLQVYIHKHKPVFGYVGLTNLLQDLQLFEHKCGFYSKNIDLEVDFFIILEKIKQSKHIISTELDNFT
jgi:hypothetical protein